MNVPDVRVSKRDGDVKWVLCVSVDCGLRLARIGGQNTRDVVLGSGWVDEPGPWGVNIWRMSRRSRERFLRGQTAAYRRSPAEGLLLIELREYGRARGTHPTSSAAWRSLCNSERHSATWEARRSGGRRG